MRVQLAKQETSLHVLASFTAARCAVMLPPVSFLIPNPANYIQLFSVVFLLSRVANYIPSYFHFTGRCLVHDFSHDSVLTLGELLTFISHDV